jgi:nicotinamide-nucleotide amidase
MSLTSEVSSMVKEIIRTLGESNESLVTAESITAGGLSAAITSVEGSSQIFLGAIVAYQDHVKTNVLGIEETVIATHTVYSQEVAVAMAQAVRIKFGATWAIATTGVAGPGPSDGVPSGTVWVAIDGPVTQSLELSLAGGRESVRNATVATAIGTFTRILRERARQVAAGR